MRIPYACLRCKSKPNKHGTVPRYAKTEHGNRKDYCEGVLCQCPGDDVLETHGETFENPCLEAHCGCCGWGGRLPPLPKKMLPWERKALDAGWAPPDGWNPSDRPTESKGL